MLVTVIERLRVELRYSPACAASLVVGCVVRNALVVLEMLGAATLTDLVGRRALEVFPFLRDGVLPRNNLKGLVEGFANQFLIE